MSSPTRQQRLDALRLRETSGALTDAERAELQTILSEIDAEEALALGPALARMKERQHALRLEKERIEAQAERLERIIGEQAKLLEEARAYLARLRARRAELADEYQRVTGTELVPRG